MISSAYNKLPILLIKERLESLLKIKSKEVEFKELSLNKNKVINSIKGIKKYIFLSLVFVFSIGVNIITKPNIIVKAEQYIIINKYDIYSVLFLPNTIATETIKPIKLKMIFIGFLSMINNKPNKIIKILIASIYFYFFSPLNTIFNFKRVYLNSMTLTIITIPFFSSLAIFLFGRYLGQKGSIIISITSIMISMILGLRLLKRYIRFNEELTLNIYNWINTGMIKISFNFFFDKFSIFMIFLITTITFVVITYSTWYMKEDAHKNRFLSILLMFAVTMLILVSSSNFFLMFVGWEGVGIMSYLLINFWYFSLNSNKSAIKAIL